MIDYSQLPVYPLYKEFGSAFQCWMIATLTLNTQWKKEKEERLQELISYLPNSERFGMRTTLDLEASHLARLVFRSSVFVGTRQVKYTVILTPSLASDFIVRIKGHFGKAQDVKAHLEELYEKAFNKTDISLPKPTIEEKKKCQN